MTAGGLIAYAPDFVENYARAGSVAGKILKGARPGDIPRSDPRNSRWP